MAPETVTLRTRPDLGRLRARLRELVPDANAFDLTRALTVASELGRNCLEHGGGGRCELELRAGPGPGLGAVPGVRTLRLRFVDAGPGIADLDAALAGGRSTRGGLGLGLGGSRRLADDFRIESTPAGTCVTVALRC